ncbi:alpha/beta fold hydrolase [Achromobacter sp. DMS1]|uniref:alpha/beta fold hydrolase n=1 Tax=Achromobacter sp. DMS1 TaxID=1688405 RepID=UPI000A803AB0|nr:alpha/beta fold hydrolase [Achromobacter sp. DMS1]
MVLIHGVGLDRGMWDELALALDGVCEVIRYDMLGHGATPLPDGQPDLDAYVAQLEAVIDGLGLQRPCVLGYSMGGLVAGRFAARHPGKLGRLVLMSTVFRRDAAEIQAVQARLRQAESGDREAAADASVERWFRRRSARRAPDAWPLSGGACWTTGSRTSWRHTACSPPAATSCRRPRPASRARRW